MKKLYILNATCFTVTLILALVGSTSNQVINPDGKDNQGSSPAILGPSSPPTVVAERGKRARLKCVYNAEPEPKVNWLKGGKEVRHDCETCISSVKNDQKSRASYLDITPFEQGDFGEYECRVRNQYGSAKLKILLKKSDVAQTKCQRERATSDDPRRKHEFRAVCNEDGSFHEVQCSIQHTICWCVNKHGKKTLDVITGVNGLRCFAPKDLSAVAIFVLTQGIVMTLFTVGQLFNIYTGYSITKIVKKYYDYYKKRTFTLKKGYKPLKERERKRMLRKLPSIPLETRLKSS